MKTFPGPILEPGGSIWGPISALGGVIFGPWGSTLGSFSALGGAIWGHLGRLGGHLWPSGAQTRKRSKNDFEKLGQKGPFWSHFGLLFGTPLASFLGPRFWTPFGTNLAPFWNRFGAQRGLKNSKNAKK